MILVKLFRTNFNDQYFYYFIEIAILKRSYNSIVSFIHVSDFQSKFSTLNSLPLSSLAPKAYAITYQRTVLYKQLLFPFPHQINLEIKLSYFECLLLRREKKKHFNRESYRRRVFRVKY